MVWTAVYSTIQNPNAWIKTSRLIFICLVQKIASFVDKTASTWHWHWWAKKWNFNITFLHLLIAVNESSNPKDRPNHTQRCNRFATTSTSLKRSWWNRTLEKLSKIGFISFDLGSPSIAFFKATQIKKDEFNFQNFSKLQHIRWRRCCLALWRGDSPLKVGLNRTRTRFAALV